jgi:hypothetical protein
MTTIEGMERTERERTADVTTPQLPLRVPRVATPEVRLGALLAIGLAAFLVGWLVMSRGGDDAAATQGGGATATSEEDLRAFAASAAHPVYWAGPKSGFTYELTQTSDGRVYVRYLPEGTEVGDPRARFLTIGTYPRTGAFAELRRAARADGAVSLNLGRGGLAVFSEARPTSVYFGYPDAKYQVEVYHPSPDEARRLALAGQVVPVR